MPRAKRIWLGRIALLACSVLLVLVLGEFAARLALGEPDRGATLTPAERASLPVYKRLSGIDRPNLDGQHRGVAFRTNSRGVRGPEYAVPKLPGVVRVGIAGDSVTMGWAVEEAKAYPAVVERMLSERRPDVRWEVLNLGLAGHAAPQVMQRLDRMDAHYRFDVLVYGFTTNDIEGPHFVEQGGGSSRKEAAARDRRALHSPSYLWRIVWPRWVSMLEWISPTPGSRSSELLFNYFENPPAWREFAASLDRLAKRSRRGERCAMVFVHTVLGELGATHPYQPVYERVGAAARERRLVDVQSFQAFAGRYEPNLWVDYYDAHPNAEAHALLAEVLAGAILQLPESCGVPASGS